MTDGGRPAVYTGMVGKLEEFDPKTDLITAYIERAALYLDANNVPEDRRPATLLSALGKSNYQILRNLVAPAKPKDKTLDEIFESTSSPSHS